MNNEIDEYLVYRLMMAMIYGRIITDLALLRTFYFWHTYTQSEQGVITDYKTMMKITKQVYP